MQHLQKKTTTLEATVVRESKSSCDNPERLGKLPSPVSIDAPVKYFGRFFNSMICSILLNGPTCMKCKKAGQSHLDLRIRTWSNFFGNNDDFILFFCQVQDSIGLWICLLQPLPA